MKVFKLLTQFVTLAVTTATLSALAPVTPAFAGGYSDGGGVVQFCANPVSGQAKVELLDFYEARNVYGLTVAMSGSTRDEIIANAYAKIEAVTDQPEIHIRPKLRQVQQAMRFLPSEVNPVPTTDLDPIIGTEPGCEFKQIARFTQDGILLVNADAWNAMDPINQAGLVLHETIYLLQRIEGVKTSRKSRKITGFLFSDKPFISVLGGIPKGALFCQTTSGPGVGDIFYAFSDPKVPGQTRLQYAYLNGHYLYSKTWVTLPWQLGRVPAEPGNFTGADLHSLLENSIYITVGFDVQTSSDGAVTQSYYFAKDVFLDRFGCEPSTK